MKILYDELLTGIPRYLNAMTCSNIIGSWVGEENETISLLALYVMILDFFSDKASLCLVKKARVIAIRLSRALGELPRIQISSAKNTADTLMPPRSRPRLVLFNS